MRDLFLFWKRHYSAVNTSDTSATPLAVINGDAPKIGAAGDPEHVGGGGGGSRKGSYLHGAGRRVSMEQGIPPIIDSFFYQRKSGEKTRQPKRKFLFTFFIVKCDSEHLL